MKTRSKAYRSVFVAGLLLLTVCALAQASPLRGVTTLTDHVTSAGQPFSLAYMPDAERISLHLIWQNDYVHTSAMPVVSALGIELMSSGGAGPRDARQIKQDMVALGSGASLVATPDHVYGTFTSIPQTLDETVSIVRHVIANPSFDQLRFDVAKEAKQKRVEAQLAQRSSILWRGARRTLLGESTLTDYWNNTPIIPVITSLTLADVERWHKETFTKQDVTVTVAGSIKADVAAEAIDRLLQDLPVNRTDTPLLNLAQGLRTGVTVLLHDESAPVTLIAAIGMLPASREGGELLDVIAVSALGKGKDSRLLKASVNDLSETDRVDASIANFSRAVRVFGINASIDTKSAGDAWLLFEETYNKFLQGNLDDQEVLRAVVPFANSLQQNENNPDLLAYGLGQLLLDELPKEKLRTVIQDAVSLKADEVNQRIIDRYPQWDDMTKVILSSDAELIEADCIVKRVEEIRNCQ